MEVATVFLPLIGAIIAGFFGRFIGDKGSSILTSSLLTLSGVFSWILFADIIYGAGPRPVELFTWIAVGDFEFSWALKMDQLTAVMLVVVNSL